MRAREWLDEERRQQREEGLQKGLQALVHLFECRLSRELEVAEREMLRSRLDVLGPERVGDVVLDLTPEALEAWLADPQRDVSD